LPVPPANLFIRRISVLNSLKKPLFSRLREINQLEIITHQDYVSGGDGRGANGFQSVQPTTQALIEKPLNDRIYRLHTES
jgi:hypothetical protein